MSVYYSSWFGDKGKATSFYDSETDSPQAFAAAAMSCLEWLGGGCYKYTNSILHHHP